MRTRPAWLDRTEWPWTPKGLPLADGELHLLDEGAGRPVVLVHGTPTWSFEWRHVIRALSGSRRVVAFDHLGFGLSERPKGAGYAPEDHARRFAEAMRHLELDAGVTLVVHDYGGPIALDWALDHVEALDRLVVLNSWMWSFTDDPAMRRRAAVAGGALGRFLYRRFNLSLKVIMPGAYGDRRRLTPAIHRHYLAPFADADSRGRVLWPLARALNGSSAFYERLWARRTRLAGLPMTIAWGMNDTAFRPDMLERWASAFPHAEIVRIGGAGHWPQEETPGAVIAALAGDTPTMG